MNLIKSKTFLTMMMIQIFQIQYAFAEKKLTQGEAFDAFEFELKFIFSGLLAIGLLSSIVIFIIHFVKLATSPSHPIQRRAAMSNLLKSGICTMLLGAINLIVTLLITTVYK